MADDAAGAERRYWAFISYSHEDAAFGRWLHRRLENYSVPRRLVGRATRQGAVPRHLAPIFRDREEFPAATDLSAEVRAALAQSRSLIVVCSPNAAASRWVSREVEQFRALHPDRPILAAIRDGEPAQSFPATLLGAGPAGERIEPLAADFRPRCDGTQLGLLKLVAGMAGLGLDELVQRDAQRNRQRVTAITVGALAAMLIMGVLTVAALNARREAEHQRAKAERLVEFMLTDLRDRLKGVGRLDVMGAVNESALQYYKDENLASLPVGSLERRARILHAMGADDEERGDLDGALKKFLEARRTTAALLAAAPNDPERIYDQAQSEFWVAFISWRRQRLDAARAGFERYAALASRLLAINPENPDWRMEAGYAASNLGMLELRDTNNPAKAEAHFAIALQHFQSALHAKPGDTDIVSDIADGYAWLADSQLALGRHREARANRLLQTKLLEDLKAKDPKNAEYARDLLGNALGLARIDMNEGRVADADRRLATTLIEAARLSTADPSDRNLDEEKIAIELFLARTNLQNAKPDTNQVTRLLADCDTPTVRSNQELMDFCAVLSARTAAARGTEDTAALEYLRRNQKRLSATRRSRLWGIDFREECPSEICRMRQDTASSPLDHR